jgi:alkylation response protein AidB-like acyl-CoA dehydrogenase
VSKPTVDELLHWLRDYASTRIDFRLQDERRCIQPHVVLDLGQRGILGGMRVPETYGGLGLSPCDTARVAEQLGAIDLTLAAWVGQNSWLGVQPIVDAGTAVHKEEFLPALATGRMLASFALTEPAAGSDPNGIETTLTEVAPDHFRLSGQKAWIGNASWAGVVSVFAKQVDRDGQPLGFTGCLVRSGTQGYQVGPELLTMGLRAAVQNRLSFYDVEVPRTDLLGEPLKGFSVMHKVMQGAQIGIAAAALGAMRRCLALQHRYVTRRHMSRGRLADYPAVIVKLNECIAKCESIASVVRQVAAIEEASPAGTIPDQVYMSAKVAASEFLWEVADGTVQMLGARGYTETNEVPRFLRDARVFRIFEGPTETLEYFLGVLAGGRWLYDFLSGQLGAVHVAQRLQSAVGEMRSRKRYFDALCGEHSQHLAHSLVGAVVRWGILLAFIDRDARLSPSRLTEMSRDWVRLHFDNALADAVSAPWDHRMALSIADIGEFLRAYEVTDVEPCSIDEVRLADRELRRLE